MAECSPHLLPLLSAGTSRTVKKTSQLVFATVLIFFESIEKFYKPGVPCTGTVRGVSPPHPTPQGSPALC